MVTDNPFLIVGWKEWVSLPDLNLPAIKAKIDTGAATSSIHAHNIRYAEKEESTYVEYEVHPIQKNKKLIIYCTSPLLTKRKVKSSSGKQQVRPVVLTTIKVGNFSWIIELNLTNRDSMGMRMLIGREALYGKILVNPSSKFLHRRLRSKKAQELYRSYGQIKNSDIIQAV
jgi:ribosomal protein S6--L-glutamate ligase